MDYERLELQAERIYDAIANISSQQSIRVAVNRPRIREAMEKLRRGYFPKPFFANAKEWLRSLVIQDRSAFKFLAGHIELEAVWNGRLYRWTGYGTKVFPNDELPPQMQELVQSKLGPFFVTIQLGTDLSGFGGLLEGVG